MSAAPDSMMRGDRRTFDWQFAGLGHCHTAMTSLEEFLGVDDQANLDDAVRFDAGLVLFAITNGVDVAIDDLMVGKVVHVNGRDTVLLDDFHFSYPRCDSTIGGQENVGNTTQRDSTSSKFAFRGWSSP